MSHTDDLMPPAARSGAVSQQPVRLGALEGRVMDLLWDVGPLTIRDIITRMGGKPAYTTISTVLRNLERKGLVRSERDGRFVVHSPRVSREQHAATVMDHALAASKDRAASILHFVQTMTDDDRALLRQYLQEDGQSGSTSS